MLRLLLATVNPKEFQVKTAKEFLFGYTDPFINTIALKIQDFRPEKIGMIGSRKGISTDSLTIFTGEDDLNNLAEVYAMNGESNMTIWSTPECNVVKGTGKVLKKKFILLSLRVHLPALIKNFVLHVHALTLSMV